MMEIVKISRKSIYGVRAMIEISIRSQDPQIQWHQIPSVAATTGIPEKFLEQILLTLKKNGFLKSRRGVDGGYALAQSPEAVSLDRLIDCLDGTALPEEEIEEGIDGSGLVFRNLIIRAEAAATAELKQKNLADLAAETLRWRQTKQAGLEFQI